MLRNAGLAVVMFHNSLPSRPFFLFMPHQSSQVLEALLKEGSMVLVP